MDLFSSYTDFREQHPYAEMEPSFGSPINASKSYKLLQRAKGDQFFDENDTIQEIKKDFPNSASK